MSTPAEKVHERKIDLTEKSRAGRIFFASTSIVFIVLVAYLVFGIGHYVAAGLLVLSWSITTRIGHRIFPFLCSVPEHRLFIASSALAIASLITSQFGY